MDLLEHKWSLVEELQEVLLPLVLPHGSLEQSVQPRGSCPRHGRGQKPS